MPVTGTVIPARRACPGPGPRSRASAAATFAASVKLAHGANVIDVAATASGRAAALTAFRVTREERVAVPDLAGLSAGDAERAAGRLDLKLESERGGGFLDSLVPRRHRTSASSRRCPARACAAADRPPAGRPLLLSRSARRHRDQPDPRLAAVAHDAEHDAALDRVAVPALDAVARARPARRGRPATARPSSS